MLSSHYTEKQISAIMQFTGLTRQETVDYLNDLYKIDSKTILNQEQEIKVFDKSFTSFRLN